MFTEGLTGIDENVPSMPSLMDIIAKKTAFWDYDQAWRL